MNMPTFAALQEQRQSLRQRRADLDLASLQLRLDERALEFQERLLMLRRAAEGVAPTGANPAVAAPGGVAFVEMLRQVNVEQVIAAVTAVQERGYCIVPDVLTAEQVERLRARLAPLFDDTARMFAYMQHPDPERRQTMHVQNVLAKTDAADEVAVLPLLRAIVGGVLGHDFIMNSGAVAMSPDPGCVRQGLHRDDGFFAALGRPHMPLVVTAAVALDDFTAVRGATHLVPGSNGWPGSRQPAASEEIQAEMPAGAMLLWDGALLHSGGGNSTRNERRRTLTLNYARGWLRTQFNQYLSVPRERVLAMPPELQRDLGYQHSAIGLGGCDTQDPLRYLQRLQKAGGDGAQTALGRERKVSGGNRDVAGQKVPVA